MLGRSSRMSLRVVVCRVLNKEWKREKGGCFGPFPGLCWVNLTMLGQRSLPCGDSWPGEEGGFLASGKTSHSEPLEGEQPLLHARSWGSGSGSEQSACVAFLTLCATVVPTSAPVAVSQGENNARKLAEAEELEGKARELVKDFQANATTRARGLNVSSVRL